MGMKARKPALIRLVTLLVVAAIASMGLSSCTETPSREESASSHASERAGDSALPELDGEYAYVLAKVVAKDADTDSIEVEVAQWEDDRPFNKSALAAGSAGSVSCSKLVFFPAGIGDGSTVVVCCLASDEEFPITAYAIEKLDLFEERVDRWAAA